MARRTQIFQQIPWSGGVNDSVDPGLLPPNDLVLAKNVVFGTSGARLKRQAHTYFDSTNQTSFALVSGTPSTTYYFDDYTYSTTFRTFSLKDGTDTPENIVNASREWFRVGEYITVTSSSSAWNAVYAGTFQITSISGDDITYDTGVSYAGPDVEATTYSITRADSYMASFDFWYLDPVTNLRIQELVVLQKNEDGDIFVVVHNPSGQRFYIPFLSEDRAVKTFDGSSGSVVDTSANSIVVTSHGYSTGDRVIYSNGGGTSITGLTTATVYYVIRVDTNTIKLATTHLNARNEVAVDITAVGAGTTHTIGPDNDDADFSADDVTQATFLPFNERLIIAFDGDGVKPRVYDPQEGNVRLLEGNPPDFFAMSRHLNRIFTNDKNNLDRLHYCETGDADVWQGVNDSGALDIFPGDGDSAGITTVFPPFKGRLFLAKYGKTYQLAGTTPEDFYPQVVTDGLGAVGPTAVSAVDLDDVIYVSDKGIHSLAATSNYGDFSGASLSKPIQNTFNGFNRSRLKYTEALYVPAINSIAFSFAGSGDTEQTKYWLYNIEGKQWYEWPDLNLGGSCVRQEDKLKKIYYALSDEPRIAKTQTGLYSDFGTDAIPFRIKTGAIYPTGNPQAYVAFKKITFFYKPRGRFTFTARVKVDNLPNQSVSFSQTADGDALGTDFILGTSVLGSDNVLAPYSLTIDGYGRGLTIEIEQTGTEEQIEIYGYAIEYESADVKQETIEASGESEG